VSTPESDGAARQVPLTALVLLGISTVALAGVTGLFASFFSLLGSCDGDGGVPYAAVDSARGQFCEFPGPLWWGITALGPGIAALAGWVLALVRRQFKPLVIGTAAAAAILVVGLAVPAVLSADCSADQKAAGANCAKY